MLRVKIVVLLLIIASSSALGQSNVTGGISGTVTDQQRAAVMNATVTVHNTEPTRRSQSRLTTRVSSV